MDTLHERGVSAYDENKDKDYMRNDLDDAGDEELEDKLIEASRSMQRPLNIEEISRLSRSNFNGGNMSMSVLSGVMSQKDY